MMPDTVTTRVSSPRGRGTTAEQLALLVDSVQDYAIFLLSPTGEILSWNAGAERTFGYPAEEAIGQRFAIFYSPGDQAAHKPELELEVAASEGRVEDEGWRVRKDATHFWADTIITAFRDQEGHVRGYAKVTRDMTTRRNAEERLRQSEEMFRLLVTSVVDYAIFMLDPQGRVATWNEGARRIKGYEPAEIIGRPISTFYTPEDIANKVPEHNLAEARKKGSHEDEGWRVRKDGTRFWADVIITAVHDESGELRGYAKVTRDMTSRRVAEERVRQSEEMFRLLVDSVREYAIFLLDPEGRVATWNEGARRIKGYEPAEIIGQPLSVFYTPEDVEKGIPQRNLELARTKGSHEDEGWRVRKDGTRFWADVILTAVHDEHGELRGFAKVTRDVTDRKHAEETQRALLEQREARLQAEEERRRAEASQRIAQEANRAKDAFLMTLSHELRTPMTAILGWSRLLPAMQPGDVGFKEAVAAIGRSAQLQARLIDDVLDVSRIMSGKLRLQIEDVEVARLVSASIDGVRASADAKMITISASLAPGLGIVSADATRLQQVLWNLLANAVKFTPRGGLIEVDVSRAESQMKITVTDNGEGIDTEFLPHIFEAFRQADSTSTRSHGGLGLGLSIVRYIVEAHGGTISAESKGLGKGATFTVCIPLVAKREAGAADDRPATGLITFEPAAPKGLLNGTSVLLVDDDLESRQLLCAVLKHAGADVVAVDSAPRALHSLSNRVPDVVLTDIAMPDMDGYALMTEIRKRPELAGVKVAAISAFARSKATDAAGFAEYLQKPIDPPDLVEAVSRLRSEH